MTSENTLLQSKPPIARPKRTSSPKLREITFDDYEQLVALTAPYGFPPSIWTTEQWRHFWTKNPAYLRIGESFPRGWVLQAGQQLVGHIASFPLFYQFDRQQLVVANGYGFVVNQEYRGYAPFLADQYWSQKLVDVVTAYQTNLEGFKTHVELGTKAVPLGAWDRKSVWITNYPEFLANRLHRKGMSAARLLAYPAGLLLSTKDLGSRMLLQKRARREIAIEICTAFDERFDIFWEELCARYPQKLLAVRSRAILEWRFDFALREQRIWVYTFTQDKRLQAYAIFLLAKSHGPQQDGARRMIVADFQSLDPNDGIFYAMLRAALRQTRRHGIHLLVTMGLSASGTDVSAMAPYRGPLPQHSTSLYKVLNPKLSRALEDPQVWCPSLFDGDMSL